MSWYSDDVTAQDSDREEEAKNIFFRLVIMLYSGIRPSATYFLR